MRWSAGSFCDSLRKYHSPARSLRGSIDFCARITEGVVRAQKSIEPRSDRAGLWYFLNESQKLPADQRIKALDEALTRAGGVERLLDELHYNTKIATLDE